MTNKDKEAFERWFYNYHFSPHYNRSGLEDAWKSACKYKDAQLEQERAKSQKLVEAMERIEKLEHYEATIASTALAEYKAKEGGENGY